MTWIITHTGQRFDLQQPTAAMVHPADIAHSLAHQCRFNGHTHEHYSVAQHCYLASELVFPELALTALLHDATEAYIGDIVSPLKQMLPNIKEIEQRIWLAICERFAIEPELHSEVRDIDLYLLAVERRDLIPATPDAWAGIEGILLPEWRIKPWSAPQARINYFNRLMQLMATTHRSTAA